MCKDILNGDKFEKISIKEVFKRVVSRLESREGSKTIELSEGLRIKIWEKDEEAKQPECYAIHKSLVLVGIGERSWIFSFGDDENPKKDESWDCIFVVDFHPEGKSNKTIVEEFSNLLKKNSEYESSILFGTSGGDFCSNCKDKKIKEKIWNCFDNYRDGFPVRTPCKYTESSKETVFIRYWKPEIVDIVYYDIINILESS